MGLLLLQELMTMMMLLLLSLFLIGYWGADQYSHARACLEEERITLLQIKNSFNATSLTSWGKDPDCCNWERVYCNSSTGRVAQLYLSVIRDNPDLGDMYLNASAFLAFQDLNYLDLNQNGIVGCLEDEGFERLSTLGNLDVLYLSVNQFSNTILSSLRDFSSLKSLHLARNRLKGWINIQELNRLKCLEILDLRGNEIEGFKSFHGTGGEEVVLELNNLGSLYLNGNRFDNNILPSLKNLSSLTKLDIAHNQLKGSFDTKELEALGSLEELWLDGNEITEFLYSKDIGGLEDVSLISLSNVTASGRSFPFSLLQSLTAFPNLKTLYLRFNNFQGTILGQASTSLKNLEELDLSYSTVNNSFLKTNGICELKQLRYLYIRKNNLYGPLPWCLANLTSLQSLDLSSNYFTGDLSSSPLRSLTSIQYLILSSNHFQIPISLTPFSNHSELKEFIGLNNEIYVELEDHNLNPRFQLERLYLSGDGQVGAFPKFLFHQYNLQGVKFFNMILRGGFPKWLLDNNTNLDELVLSNTSLSGPFQLPLNSHLELWELDISENYFHGHIPMEIGTIFPNLAFLSMSGNDFNGSIPTSLCGILSLYILDLSVNNISATLPSCFNSSPLWQVYLSHNSLQGSLGDTFVNSSELITLDLSHNQFIGGIPEWIGDIFQLSFLLLGDNNLGGRLPIQLCKLDKLRFIDLSLNNFSGSILPCLRLRSSIWGFQLDTIPQNYYIREPLQITTKSISYSYPTSILPYISGMDLSCNNLMGEIPSEIGNLNHIHLLNLSNNHLTGPIPQTFSNLSEVESLDLSNNNLNGKIPSQLVELHSLSFFSVAHNNLSGRTPDMVAQFSTFNESSYEDNPFICGPPLSISCIKEEASPSLPIDNAGESGYIDTKAFYASFIATYVIVLLGMATVLYINPNWRRAWFYIIAVIINNCYYFLVDNFLEFFGFRGQKPFV